MISGLNPRIEAEMSVEPKELSKYIKVLAKGFRAHIGKGKSITADQIAKGLRNYSPEFKDCSGIKIRKIIQFMRHRDALSCLMSLGRGYWIASCAEDAIATLQFLDDKRRAEEFTLMTLREQVEQRFGCKINIIHPNEASEEDGYRTVFLS